MSRNLLLPVLILGIVCHPALVEGKGGPKGKGGGGSAFKGGGRGGAPSKVSRPSGGPAKGTMKSDQTLGAGRGSGQRATKPDHSFGSGRGSGATKSFNSEPTSGPLKGRDHALNVQRANEERKLTHRQQTAEKLRQIAERNGNENLMRTADKMDEQALDHYEKRLSKIDSVTPQDAAAGLDGMTDPLLDQPSVAEQLPQAGPASVFDGANSLQDVGMFDAGRIEGLTPADARRLAQEDWKLQHQLDVAQRLRENAARNGNENLIRTAERMETMAAERYQSQLEKFGLFEVLQPPAVPTEPAVLPPL